MLTARCENTSVPTRKIGAVSLLEHAMSDLLARCRLVDVAVKPAKRVVLNDSANELAGLAYDERKKELFYLQWDLCTTAMSG